MGWRKEAGRLFAFGDHSTEFCQNVTFPSGLRRFQKLMSPMEGRQLENAGALVVFQCLQFPRNGNLHLRSAYCVPGTVQASAVGVSLPVVWWEPRMTKSILFTVIHEFLINLLGEFMKSEEVEQRN